MARRTRESSSGAPRNDAYTGLLAISLLAQIIGVVFFYMDFDQYKGKPSVPPIPKFSEATGGGAPPVGQNPQGAVNP